MGDEVMNEERVYAYTMHYAYSKVKLYSLTLRL